jgi:hypothetical protein
MIIYYLSGKDLPGIKEYVEQREMIEHLKEGISKFLILVCLDPNALVLYYKRTSTERNLWHNLTVAFLFIISTFIGTLIVGSPIYLIERWLFI